jgi:membrane-bound lytic murein transglycosylase MltF
MRAERPPTEDRMQGTGTWLHRLASLLVAVSLIASAGLAAAAEQAGTKRQGLAHGIDRPWSGDLDGMLERRQVRLLVVPSKTFFFVDKGQQRGLSHDRGKAFEEALNRKLGKKGRSRVEVVFVPVSRDDLLPALIQGRGDIAAANLTITPERQAWVDFSAPLWSDVDEIVVTGPDSPPITSLDDLSGREIFVRLSSSYFQSLWHLNESFGRAGKAPVRVKPAPEQLEDEDLLEMVNAGLTPIAIVDRYKAEFWAQILPGLVLHPDVTVRSDADVAWAFRKGSPQLAAALDEFARSHGKGTLFGNAKFREYLKNVQYVKAATSREEIGKFLRTIQIFQTYADRYEFDWLLLAAQGYQESRLDQQVKSRVGALGVMQLMPATGKEMGVGDVRQIEANIHAGAKYMRKLIDDYFPDPELDDLNRCLFAFAGYNAGPNRIARLRVKAADRGLDPDVWFGNVEQVVAEEVGQEPVRYVANIFKYYIAYQLVVEQQAERERALRSAAPAP